MIKLLLALAALLCLGLVVESRRTFDLAKHPRALFKEYLEEYPRTFASEKEKQERYRIFVHNVLDITNMNKKHAGKTTFSLNKFSLMSKDEFRAYRQGGVKGPRSWNAFFGVNMSHMAPLFSAAEVAAAPTSVDWRTHSPPVVTAVKDQGQCGDCWAFSTTGNVEGQWALAGHNLVSLSEQNLCDCDHVCIDGNCDQGCDGGLMANAMTYIIKNGGIDTEASYPYKGVAGKCKFNAANVGAKISSYTMIAHDPVQMATYVATKGPISIAVDAETWQNYQSGIIKNNCGTQLDHGVLIVGYGVSKNIPYWIVKNSWSEDWGMQGYVLVERGTDNMCGIDKYPISSVV